MHVGTFVLVFFWWLLSGQGGGSYGDEWPSPLGPLSNPANDESLLSLTPKLESLGPGSKTGGKKYEKKQRAGGGGV